MRQEPGPAMISSGLPKVQSMARHASINTTMIYYHEADRVEDPAEGYVRYEGEDA